MQLRFLLAPLMFLALQACSRKASPGGDVATSSPVRVVEVKTASELKLALSSARPGDEIRLADGTYSGRFVVPANVNGDEKNRIVLTGSNAAVLDGGSIETGYALHLQSSYWTVKGIRITNALKGLMADGVTQCIIDGVVIDHVGEEALHLRKFSLKNEVRNCRISYAGLKTPSYGEGIYIGSAYSNWPTYTNGDPDRSDSNRIVNNIIGPFIAAECIDVKEGTTGGLISGNQFNSEGITGANSADSWMDVKGNGYLIEKNKGTNPAGSVLLDGFQVHVAYAGWGNSNVFKENECIVNAAGYAILIKLSSSAGTATGNKVYTSNTATGAALGISNISLSN